MSCFIFFIGAMATQSAQAVNGPLVKHVTGQRCMLLLHLPPQLLGPTHFSCLVQRSCCFSCLVECVGCSQNAGQQLQGESMSLCANSKLQTGQLLQLFISTNCSLHNHGDQQGCQAMRTLAGIYSLAIINPAHSMLGRSPKQDQFLAASNSSQVQPRARGAGVLVKIQVCWKPFLDAVALGVAVVAEEEKHN